MLTEAEIKRLIEDDAASDRKRQAAVGLRYYEGEHDILKLRFFYYNGDGKLVEDTFRSNVKICHPYFTELSDQHTAHLLSFKRNPIRAKENTEGLQGFLDLYFNARFWSEIGEMVTGAYNKGFEYLYAYKNKGNRLSFQCADSMGVVEIREKDTDDGREYYIYWYIDRIDKGRKEIRRIQVWSEKDVTYWVQAGEAGRITLDSEAPINPRPHVVYRDGSGSLRGYGLDRIPFFRFDNCKKQVSGLRPVKALIDDYDIHACSLSNNLIDFDQPLLVVKGYEGQGGEGLNEVILNTKTKKTIITDEEGGVERQVISIPYEARKAKLDIDERNIYHFGMGFNPSQVGDGNITNVVIRSRYSLLEMKTKKTETRLCAMLEDSIIPLVLDEINREHQTGFTIEDIYFDFSRDTVTNESENVANEKVRAETRQIEINNILNLATSVGEEQTLRAICDLMEWSYEDIKAQVEQTEETLSVGSARTVLDKAPVDQNEVKEEAQEELGKPLNGAQTQSLISVIQQWKGDVLDTEQAVQIIAMSVGCTTERARKLLNLQAV